MSTPFAGFGIATPGMQARRFSSGCTDSRKRYCADGKIEEQQMALNIRHAETERLASELAEMTGEERSRDPGTSGPTVSSSRADPRVRAYRRACCVPKRSEVQRRMLR